MLLSNYKNYISSLGLVIADIETVKDNIIGETQGTSRTKHSYACEINVRPSGLIAITNATHFLLSMRILNIRHTLTEKVDSQ